MAQRYDVIYEIKILYLQSRFKANSFRMIKATKLLLIMLFAWMFLISGCSILKKNSCGCPPIPTTGRLRH
jgi:hypothetical protein